MDEKTDDCGCCSGIDAETPKPLYNRPGLPAVNYRVGTYHDFKESMLARLSSTEYPALASFTARDDSDIGIAWCDAAATVLDVLGFYQERIANENFLRTAGERRSLLELAKLIGYELAPGVAASTHLAFTLQEAPGLPAGIAEPVTIPVGTRVQSVPARDEAAQSFETVEAIQARPEWNAMTVQTGVAWQPEPGDTELYLAGVSTTLQVGDVILIVGQERVNDTSAENWEIRMLSAVEPDPTRGRTRVAWLDPIGQPPAEAPKVFVFRQRASLFGHNAPDPRLMVIPKRENPNGDFSSTLTSLPNPGALSSLEALVEGEGANLKWKNYVINAQAIDLDAAYPKIAVDSWFALVSNEVDEGGGGGGGRGDNQSFVARTSSETSKGTASLPGSVALRRMERVSVISRMDFGLSGKITRIAPDTTEDIDSTRYGIAKTLVLAQSEQLETAPRPILSPLYGSKITLGSIQPNIKPDHTLAVSGKRQRITIAEGAKNLKLKLDGGGEVALKPGDSLRLEAAPEQVYASLVFHLPSIIPVDARDANPSLRLVAATGQTDGGTAYALSPEAFGLVLGAGNASLRLRVRDRDDRIGMLDTKAQFIRLQASTEEDEALSEIVWVGTPENAVEHGRDYTTLHLDAALALQHVYERESVRINANVASATHGEAVSETVGSGSAARANQSFPLRQSPLTYVSAATASGRASTLELRVNDLLWREVPSLFGQPPTDPVYTLETDDIGHTRVVFGDGVEGARLPSGQDNIRARYRKGIGAGGNVAVGKLSNLLSRPYGVSGAVNPEAASGGQNAESGDAARTNAPRTVLTLERAVSIQDYEDFARSFAGIAKAHAVWIPSGPGRGVFISLSGEKGVAVADNSDTYRDLLASLRKYGDPLLPLRLSSYRGGTFKLRAAIKIMANADIDLVLAEADATLRMAFSFEERQFGQMVSVDEVMTVLHGVTGVEAVNVLHLYRSDEGATPRFKPRLFARLPEASLKSLPQAAELLLLDEAKVELEVMP